MSAVRSSLASPLTNFVGRASLAWAGYVVTDPHVRYESVSASWFVPRVNCASSSTNAATAAWVGVNGWSRAAPGLFQVGTNSQCASGVESSYAWWSDQKNGYAQRTLFPVATGALVDATVRRTTSRRWSYRVRDVTSGASASRAEVMRATARSAEWIVEDPSSAGITRRVPLAAFSPITFHDLSLEQTGSGWRRPSARDAVEMVSPRGVIEATPGLVMGGAPHTSFTVTQVRSKAWLQAFLRTAATITQRRRSVPRTP